MKVLHKLPSIYRDGDPLPEDIQGSRLVQIGTTDNDSESGELVIEYVPKNQRLKRRLVLLFDGRGMWIEALEECV